MYTILYKMCQWEDGNYFRSSSLISKFRLFEEIVCLNDKRKICSAAEFKYSVVGNSSACTK